MIADIGIDDACVWIDGEQHRTGKTMTLGKNLANCGNASSDRYSSSPETSTMCLSAPGPALPLYVTHGSSALAVDSIADMNRTVMTSQVPGELLVNFILQSQGTIV